MIESFLSPREQSRGTAIIYMTGGIGLSYSDIFNNYRHITTNLHKTLTNNTYTLLLVNVYW